ncbi:MAG: hypothetical protein IT342_13975 [Candidatus Melainabacteria bacterium]|nr:hypothetical protein [Candidatus Melainabacteria bacterium]
MIKYILSPKGIILLAFAGAVVAVSVLMAWSELGFAGTLPDWLTDLTTRLGLHGMIAGFFNSLTPGLGNDLVEYLKGKGVSVNPKSTASLGDYGYILFMGVALTLAGIGIMIIGREDAEEKTVLPVKK